MSELLEKSIAELEIDAGELNIQRQRVCMEKNALLGEIGAIKTACTKRLPTPEFNKLQSKKGNLLRQLADKEQEIGALNSARAELNTVLEVRKSKVLGRFQVKELVDIRDRWHAFSMDATQNQKAREVAWKFSQELGTVLKSYFSANQ